MREGFLAYFAALRGTDEDFARIQACQEKIRGAQDKGDIEAESAAVMAYCFNRGSAQCGVITYCSQLGSVTRTKRLRKFSCCIVVKTLWRK